MYTTTRTIMTYEPPKYPSAIPTTDDLPDRTDDIDWMYAARYNELKKELRATLIELGTDPAGTFATVKARLDDLLPHYHDRGDPADYDWTAATLITDGTWRDLDLSGIVPAGAKAVLLSGTVMDDLVGQWLYFRKNGNINDKARCMIGTQVANTYLGFDVMCACDTNRVIEYNAENIEWGGIYITVKGWWK